MKTLITGGKSAQAIKVSRAFPAADLILADYGTIPAFNSAKFQLISLGERNETIIAHHLLTSCLDLQVECLVPLYSFEREALLRSSLLFEEFNIQILLPERTAAREFIRPAATTLSALWAVYHRGVLQYSSEPEYTEKLIRIGSERKLNGIYQMEMKQDELRPYLMQIEPPL